MFAVPWRGESCLFARVRPVPFVPSNLPRRVRCVFQDVALSILATVAMSSALIGAFYPLPQAPFVWFPYGFLLYLLIGAILYLVRRRKQSKMIVD